MLKYGFSSLVLKWIWCRFCATITFMARSWHFAMNLSSLMHFKQSVNKTWPLVTVEEEENVLTFCHKLVVLAAKSKNSIYRMLSGVITSSERLNWDVSHTIRWSDFQGKPNAYHTLYTCLYAVLNSVILVFIQVVRAAESLLEKKLNYISVT